MKNWELTLKCTEPLRKVLEAVERTQLTRYCIEQNFYDTESALEAFLEELREHKEQHYLQKEEARRRNRNYEQIDR